MNNDMSNPNPSNSHTSANAIQNFGVGDQADIERAIMASMQSEQ